jgi:hypothetical protein
MADDQKPPAPTGKNPPKGQTIWQCFHCSLRYLTEQPPAQCPYCLRPVEQ